MRLCSLSECGQKHFCQGFCRVHFERWKRHGNPHVCLKPMVKRGEPLRWLREHASHIGGDCLLWPFARFPDGRAHMKAGKPSRIMCELAHGPAPSPRHEAAHSCGKANDGCVNPRHLRWATPVENAADKERHGTVIWGERHGGAKLTSDDVRHIIQLRGTIPQKDIAARFGVAESCISKILNGGGWKRLANG